MSIMADTGEADGSEDVNDFLRRIRELGNKRDREDEERARRLEEEILQGRKERQARRAERARSISPTKDSPPFPGVSPSGHALLSASASSQSIEPPVELLPSSPAAPAIAPVIRGISEVGASKTASPSTDGPTITGSAMASARSGTLSWKQRPVSKETIPASSVPSSPLVTKGSTEFESLSSEPNLVPREDSRTSRRQIAQSLGSKDPLWFRQTADRGLGSPAYRRSQDGPVSDLTSVSGNMRLPGLSRELTTELEKPTSRDQESERSQSPSRASSFYGSSSLANRYSSVSSVSTTGGLGSPAPILSTQRSGSRVDSKSLTNTDIQPPDHVAMSPSQGRLTTDRQPSPTKGLGGFVQSAMMKRSDSVTKRWSAQSGPGIARGIPTYSDRGDLAGAKFGKPISTPSSADTKLEISILSTSRPGSSHSEATVIRHPVGDDQPGISGPPGDSFIKPPPPSQPALPLGSITDTSKPTEFPTSPSKTMDPKRWSPTKATWLESALNRPDSIKAKPQPPQQPDWKRDLNKLKQARANVDLGNPDPFKDADTAPTLHARTSTENSPRLASKHGLLESVGGLPVKAPGSRSPPKPDPGQFPHQESEEHQPGRSLKAPDDLDLRAGSVSASNFNADVPETSTTPPSRNVNPEKAATDIITSKPKPQVPPIKDFRAGLRHREATSEAKPTDEPEFRKVFGKLKKATTKNFVAPDELKENILKGKAALSVTGGPKKTERVDEFKESILKQKEAMKAGGGSIRRKTTEEKDKGLPAKPAKSPPIPEALSRRANLTKSENIARTVSGNSLSAKSLGTPPVQGLLPEVRLAALNQSSLQRPNYPLRHPRDTAGSQELQSIVVEGREGTDANIAANPGDSSSEGSTSVDKAATSEPQTFSMQQSLDPRLEGLDNELPEEPLLGGQSRMGKLADRLNPALAGILSRGPPAPSTAPSNASVSIPRLPETSPRHSPTLTHMTKQRARGPKRRLPRASNSSVATSGSKVGDFSRRSRVRETPSPGELPSQSPDGSVPDTVLLNDKVPRYGWEKPIVPQEQFNNPESLMVPSALNEATESRVKPTVSPKCPELKKTLLPGTEESAKENPTRNHANLPEQVVRINSADASKTLPSEPDTGREKNNHGVGSHFAMERPTQASRSTILPSAPAPSPKSRGSDSPHVPPKPRMASRTLSSPHLADSGGDLGMRSTPAELSPTTLQNRTASPPVTTRIDSAPIFPKTLTAVSRSIKPALDSRTSPFPQSSEAAQIFSTFFDAAPKSSDKVEIDSQLLLSRRDSSPKIKTLRKQIWELSGDGKKQDLPSNQGYILFEECMYLCIHSFENPNGGKATEVSLWCGDGVSEAAVEDAQLFARKAARENSCKLEILRQGKETMNFIQALGGIIITRRGSSSRSSSSSLYMLCGRRHMGQIAFDEVNLSASSLCSGYPYLISAKFGKLYLWQGRGSAADELGCARLIGMDLGLTGEIEEVAEGEEPKAFFDAFPDSGNPANYPSAEHWRLKPNYDRYCCRLFRIDHELGQRFGSGFWSLRGASSPVNRPNDLVQEIDPFCQKDLEPGHIYVLDAFFEIIVIIGEQASSRSAEFASALVFAQEYGILAVSMQDRPFIPKGSVVLNGLPEECKRAFRKWEDNSVASHGKIVKVLPLDAAIEAIRY